MPGIKLLTNLAAPTCLKTAWRTAQDLGYSLTPIEDNSKRFTATKGNAIVAIIAGALAPHCAFQISVQTYGDANELVLEVNKPWLTGGAVGVARVARQAQELLGAIITGIEKEGGKALETKEF